MDTVESMFTDLESNNADSVRRAKTGLAECFTINKEPWLINGIMEYFCNTNSSRIVEILVKVQSPHDTYIFDRLVHWMNGSNKNEAITLFGHIVKHHPSWLYKVANHQLFKDILKLLKSETNIILIMNALYCIFILLSIIPTAIPQYLSELFDIFLYLAILKSRVPEDQLIHLQIGLSYYFQHLYGMYPCNFIAYLQDVSKDHREVYLHTIHPLLETVKMHPLLLTSNRDQEKSNVRWNGMEPHDVVVECSRFSLDHVGGGSSSSSVNNDGRLMGSFHRRLSLHGGRQQQQQLSVSEQLRHSMNTATTMPSTSVSLQFYSLFNDPPPKNDNQFHHEPQRIDNMWSPMLSVLATPPPMNVVPGSGAAAAAAPLHSFAVQTPGVVAVQQQQCASGASPPEAAVEATPETTPMKDCAVVRTYPTNSSAVRAIWGVSSSSSSQPSSPLKKNVITGTAFRYGIDAPTQQIVSVEHQHQLSSPKIRNFVTERSMYQQQQQQQFHQNQEQIVDVETPAAPFNRSAEIEHVNEPILSSNKLIDDQSNSGVFITSEADISAADVSPKIGQRMKVHESSDDSRSGRTSADFISRSLPAESALSKRRRTRKLQQQQQPPSNDEHKTGDTNAEKVVSSSSSNKNVSTQTIMQIEHVNYEDLFLSQQPALPPSYNVEKSTTICSSTMPAIPPMSPHTLLDQYIEATSKKSIANPANLPEMYRDQIHLLNLLLQFERYRREVHAERNRRLLGKSRTNVALEMDNTFLREQEFKLSIQVEELTQQLNEARIDRNNQEHEYTRELIRVRREQQMELDANRGLRETIEMLNRKLTTEMEVTRTVRLDLDGARAELFDLRNELQQTKHLAEMGQVYKVELNRLQAEVLLMGELQLKCKEKMSELSNMRALDAELNAVQLAYNNEVKDMRHSLDVKSAQLEGAKAQIVELESQLIRRDSMFIDQKRLLKTVKEEYRDRIRALEEKYTAQKAVILRLEEEMLELYNKTQLSVGGAAYLSPSETDRTDIAGSIDTHPSPLSISLASSDGLSLSLRSVPEIRNLHPLVVDGSSGSGHGTATDNTASGSGANRQQVSEDIPVPSSSTMHHHHLRH